PSPPRHATTRLGEANDVDNRGAGLETIAGRLAAIKRRAAPNARWRDPHGVPRTGSPWVVYEPMAQYKPRRHNQGNRLSGDDRPPDRLVRVAEPARRVARCDSPGATEQPPGRRADHEDPRGASPGGPLSSAG